MTAIEGENPTPVPYRALHKRAIALLAKREYSRGELQAKLAPFATQGDIDKLLTYLTASGLQSDERCARSDLLSHAGRLGLGRLRQRLRQRYLGEALIEHCISSLFAESAIEEEWIRATSIWQRRFTQFPTNRKDWAKQARFLQYRGFPDNIIRKVIPRVEV